MSASLLADTNGAKVYHADWRALLGVVLECDTLIVDAPYSERTHAGHDGAIDQTRLAGEERRQRVDKRTGAIYSVGVNRRRKIAYSPWTAADVTNFVDSWHSRVNGWFVSITDHALAPAWSQALEAVGRYVFAPLAYVAPGSRVRLLGDGPSNWTTWIVVARPRTRAAARWGTLPGAYVLPPGMNEMHVAGGANQVVGGKPSWLMERLCEDYSRPGDLVVDPTCGAGTTLVAAMRTGRRAIGGDILLEHAKLAAARISAPQQQPLFLHGAAR